MIGINSGEVFDMPLGHNIINRLRLPDHGCKVIGPADDPLPWRLRADILPEGGVTYTYPQSRIHQWRDPGFQTLRRRSLTLLTSP